MSIPTPPTPPGGTRPAGDPLRDDPPPQLSAFGCLLVLVTAFLGWMFAGIHLSISSLVMRVAAKALLGSTDEGEVGLWFGWLICAFLLGAAAGGYLFGRIGDRYGRARAMGLSILCYSLFSLVSAFAQDPWQLLILRFLTCLGVGGMWPNGIALVSEAWPNISRPFLAGAIGTAANVGILLFSVITCYWLITNDAWRWTLVLGATPAVLGLFVLAAVPESPRWRASWNQRKSQPAGSSSSAAPGTTPTAAPSVFRPPLLRITALGIALGAVPLFGGWGSSNWATAWASQVGDRTPGAGQGEEDSRKADPTLKSQVSIYRSLPGSITSLLGGALALMLGRRFSYFLLSFGALFSAQYLFWFLEPGDPQFLYWTAALGAFSGFYFGWLPLCLPEMFPTHVRSTGSGVSFNFGRILTAGGVLLSAELVRAFSGDYAQIGRITSLVYVVGIVIVFFMPDTSQSHLDD